MKNRSVFALALAVIAAAALSGCASSANREAMTAQDMTLAKRHDQTVSVKTAGGSETGAMDSSNIEDADFKAAIEDSIKNSKVFRSIVQGKEADYELSVSIIHLDKPVFGLTFTVNMEATWVLVKQSDRSVVMKKSIQSTHSAGFSDAAAGVTRLRLAVEGAARKNIEQGLQAIAALSL
ncbi:MAG: hypothetical protein H6943_02780 [Zoogloeaceae bacterium]|nr:hypothetical protein [Zoogloeaceae bacterium]